MVVDVARQLAEFTTEMSYETIPGEVINYTKVLLLKTIAGMVAGSAKPASQKMATLIKDRKLPKEVAIVGNGFKSSLWEATFLHGFFAHASELEDSRPIVDGASWDITVAPVSLSLAGKLKLSGKAVLEASALGLEIEMRTCLFPTQHLNISVIPGAVGPAACAAKILGLNAEQTRWAFGLALAGSHISMVNRGFDAHYLEAALQCLQGLASAEMAKENMTSNPDIVSYLSKLLGPGRVNPDAIVEDLGKRWLLRDIWIRRYPSCAYTHRQIDILLEIMRKNHLSYDQIEVVEVNIGPGNNTFCDRPEPKTEGDVQFSFQHVLAAVMVDGDLEMRHISEASASDPRLREARSKVKVIFHEDWPAGGLLVNPGRVTVRAKNGKVFSGERMFPIGSDKEPLTIGQFRELYSKFTRDVLPEKVISSSADAILNMEKIDDIGQLMDILSSRK